MKLTSLSIVIPCFNTESTVKKVVMNAFAIGKQITSNLEIIALDDASVDSTLQILTTCKKQIPVLRIERHSLNMGYGETIKELYSLAKNKWIFSLPSDDQFDADEIVKLLPYTSSSDMILGLRAVRNDRTERKVQSCIYNSLLRTLFGLSLHDINTIRLMKRDILSKIRLSSHTAFVDAELAIRMKHKGMTICEVPILHKIRQDRGGSGGKFVKTILPTIIDMARMKMGNRI